MSLFDQEPKIELPPAEQMRRAAELQKKMTRANFALAVLANEGVEHLAQSSDDGHNSATEARKAAAQEIAAFLREFK